MATKYIGVIIRHLAPHRPVTMRLLSPPSWVPDHATMDEVTRSITEEYETIVSDHKLENPDMASATYYLDVRAIEG